MAAVRSDRIGVPIGLHERRVLAWLRASAGDALAGRRAWSAASLPGGHAAGRRLRTLLISLLGDIVEEDRADHVGGTIQARPVVAAR
jgi:hypothetical protein